MPAQELYQSGVEILNECDDSAAASLERARALEALGDNRLKSLMAIANFRSYGLDVDGEDLLQGAYVRWLKSNVPVGDTDDTYKFLIGAINSQRTNSFRHKKVVKRTIGERKFAKDENSEDPVYEIAARQPSPDDSIYLQQIFDLVTDDPDVQLLLMCQGQQATRAETLLELGWDEKKYETVRKRKIRRVAKLFSEGVI